MIMVVWKGAVAKPGENRGQDLESNEILISTLNGLR